MKTNEAQDIEHGMSLIPQLPEVMPDTADERIKPVYKDVQQTLRVPFINFIFRALANYPDYLIPAWSSLNTVLRTPAFEHEADRLRAKALLEPGPDASRINAAGLGDADQIRAFTDSIHYVLPKLLLIATAWSKGLTGENDQPSVQASSASANSPPGIAEGTVKVQMVNPKDAAAPVKALFQDLKQAHNHPGVASYYRALGNWPEFLEVAWQNIRPVVNSAAYQKRRQDLIQDAETIVRELPLPTVAPPQELDAKQVEEIRSILAVFRFRLIPDLLLDVTLIKAMLDGVEAAHLSPFSLAGPNV